MDEDNYDNDETHEEIKVTYLLYQRVELDINFKDETINGITTLWLGLREKDSIKDKNEDDENKVLETISLHCRNCNISNITINGTPVHYTHNDPLKSFNLDDPTTYQGEEADVRYRAALEISRAGELRISLPNVVPTDTKPLQELPEDAPNEVIQRFKKLNNAYEKLKPKTVPKWLGDDDEITELAANEKMEHTTSGRLLQVCINYKIDKQPTGLTTGFIFRKPYSHIDIHRGKQMMGSKSAPVCMYTTGGSPGLLRDLDGSRCWMPCIDSPDQRAVFDVTIKAPAKFEVICSGISVSTKPSVDFKKVSHRFVTITRIPAMCIGFFIGKVEAYTMPLYKTDGRFLVARGLQDFIFSSEKSNKLHRKISKLSIKNYVNSTEINDPDVFVEMKGDNDNDNDNENKSKKRPRGEEVRESKNDADDDEDGVTDYVNNDGLYVEEVRHTTLGLDLGMRTIHRQVGRKYDQKVYSQIFVPGLTTNAGYGIAGHSISFDGFSLVDGAILHTNEQVYMELPSHIQQITAYLYSWLKSGLPIDSYNSEFIVHGVVGYLTNIYIDHVFGEDIGQFRFQKMVDFIVEYEKMGKGKQLVSFYPENYDCLSPVFRQYNYYKSALLLSLIEHRLGGKDPMTMALSEIIKSPPLVQRKRVEPKINVPTISPRLRAGSLTGRARAGSITSDNGDNAYTKSRDQYYNNEMSPDPYSDMSPNSLQMSPSTYAEMSPYGGLTSPNPYGGNPYGIMSPNPYGNATYGGMMSPNHYNSNSAMSPNHYNSNSAMSPNPYGGMMSPNPYGGNNYYYTGNLGYYGSTQQATATDMFALSCDCISTQNFVELIHRVGGSESELSLSYLDKFLNDGTSIFARMYLTNEREKKAINVTIESLNSRSEMRSKLSNQKDELFLRVIEVKDDLATDHMFGLGAKEEYNYRQQIHLKVGRKLGTRFRRSDDEDEQQLREQEQLSMKTALQLARNCELPVKAIYLDPQFHHAAEIHIIGPDCLLVEQLFTLNDNKDVLRQIQAIRSLSRAHSLGRNKNGGPEVAEGATGKYPLLQLKALYECLIATLQQDVGLHDKNVMSRPHCPQVRAEAAFGLARWQNERSPRMTTNADALANSFQKSSSIQDVDKLMQSGSWQGLAHLISALQVMYMIENLSLSDGKLFVPWTIDAAREDDMFLRNSILLALSTIRAQNDLTPNIVVEILLQFAEHSITSSISTSGNDESYYKAVLLLCLSRMRVESVNRTNTNTSTHTNEANQEDNAITRITKIIQNCQLSDLAFSRTKARISQKPSGPNMMPLLVADGLLSVAALTCAMEMDIMTIYNLSRNKVKYGEEWRFLPTSMYEKNGVVGPKSIGEETKIDYVCYFLPSNCKLGLTNTDDGSNSSSFNSSKYISSSSSNCPPLLRQVALEAFVRICFKSHYVCNDRLNKRIKNPNNPTIVDPKLAYLAAAIEAVVIVIQNDPCRGTRQAAAMTLLDALQDRPTSRSLSSALSLGEPILCQGYADPLAATLPSGCESSSLNGMKTNHSRSYTASINLMV